MNINLFLEHWLPDYEATAKFSKDFPNYKFLTTSSDMFTNAEDKMLESGPTWHGSAIFWPENIDQNISRLPVICDWFCGVKYTDK